MRDLKEKIRKRSLSSEAKAEESPERLVTGEVPVGLLEFPKVTKGPPEDEHIEHSMTLLYIVEY